MINWKICEKDFDENKIAEYGNKFLIGNGYMGVRGTLDEYRKSQLVAVNLAGIYDKVGEGWREPINAPNGFYGYLVVDGKKYSLPETKPIENQIELDYRNGIFKRYTVWNTDRGNIHYESERFVSMANVHQGMIKCSIWSDFHADVDFYMGIDTDVWDINGPHFDIIQKKNDELLEVNAITHEKHYSVFVAEGYKLDFPHQEIRNEIERNLNRVSFVTDINKKYEIERCFFVYTSKDCKDYKTKACEGVKKSIENGYHKELAKHKEVWEKIWTDAQVIIEGYEDNEKSLEEADKAMEALNYSTYHLNSIAPRHTDSLSIAARGLSGQTYKGAVFWDTEMFMLDFFLMTDPDVAKTLIKYRIDSLEGAKEKAASYGYQGAFYPWESQERGFDACSDYNVTDVFTKRPMRTFFRDKQVHISSAIVYGIAKYMEWTGDTSLLNEGGAETIIECAKFYLSLLVKKVIDNKYEIHDVIGPDEYHERVNNNGYTNRMAKFTFEQAIKVISEIENLNKETQVKLATEYNLEHLYASFSDAFNNIYIPMPNEEGIIPQFDGYFELEDASIDDVRSRLLDPKEYWGGAYGVATHTQIIKQADIVTWLAMFPTDFSFHLQEDNWKYYEPRTEHGSSLSACMYSLLACKCNMTEKAYPLFMKSASADLVGGGKEWAGLVYIGGTHPASEGGAYMVAIKGFAGVNCHQGKLTATPNLPDLWKLMRFNIKYKGKKYSIEIIGNKVEIK